MTCANVAYATPLFSLIVLAAALVLLVLNTGRAGMSRVGLYAILSAGF